MHVIIYSLIIYIYTYLHHKKKNSENNNKIKKEIKLSL